MAQPRFRLKSLKWDAKLSSPQFQLDFHPASGAAATHEQGLPLIDRLVGSNGVVIEIDTNLLVCPERERGAVVQSFAAACKTLQLQTRYRTSTQPSTSILLKLIKSTTDQHYLLAWIPNQIWTAPGFRAQLPLYGFRVYTGSKTDGIALLDAIYQGSMTAGEITDQCSPIIYYNAAFGQAGIIDIHRDEASLNSVLIKYKEE